MSKILVTGMSGTGKSSVLAELGRRGYRVVDTDDPGWREYHEYVESPDELRRGEWLWVEERITELLDSDDGRSLFVQGCVRNQSKFYDRFDAVVLLQRPRRRDPRPNRAQNDERLRQESRGTGDDLGRPRQGRATAQSGLPA
jgi:broad-specificity NMP kinase